MATKAITVDILKNTGNLQLHPTNGWDAATLGHRATGIPLVQDGRFQGYIHPAFAAGMMWGDNWQLRAERMRWGTKRGPKRPHLRGISPRLARVMRKKR